MTEQNQQSTEPTQEVALNDGELATDELDQIAGGSFVRRFTQAPTSDSTSQRRYT